MDTVLDDELAELRPGKTLKTRGGARLTVGNPLGGGNEGTVFEATLDGRSVALKVFKRDDTGRREQRTRALARLDLSRNVSPALAAPFDVLSWRGRTGHVAPFAPGIALQDLVDAPDFLSPRQRIVAVLKLGALMLQLHRRGLAFGDLNKGAVKLQRLGAGDVDVALVDLDSMALPGESAPLTMGTPDTSAPELRRGQQPSSVAAWQAADWTAFGHVSLELLLAKTAGCGIEDPIAQVNAFMGVPPCLHDTAHGQAIDRAAGLPARSLPDAVRRPLARMFDPEPARRNGAAFIQALTGEFVNNHQVACTRCGLQYLVHDDLSGCPSCGHAASHAYRAYLPNGTSVTVGSQGVALTRELLGGSPALERMHARLFTIGGVPFVCAHGRTVLQRHRTAFLLPSGIHVPLMRGDRLGLNGVTEIFVY